MQYDVLKHYTLDTLIYVVNDRIKTGWVPLGAPFQYGNAICQAMTKG